MKNTEVKFLINHPGGGFKKGDKKVVSAVLAAQLEAKKVAEIIGTTDGDGKKSKGKAKDE